MLFFVIVPIVYSDSDEVGRFKLCALVARSWIRWEFCCIFYCFLTRYGNYSRHIHREWLKNSSKSTCKCMFSCSLNNKNNTSIFNLSSPISSNISTSVWLGNMTAEFRNFIVAPYIKYVTSTQLRGRSCGNAGQNEKKAWSMALNHSLSSQI